MYSLGSWVSSTARWYVIVWNSPTRNWSSRRPVRLAYHAWCSCSVRTWLERGITTATVTSPEGLSEALYQALVTPDCDVNDAGGGRGPVFTVPPLRGDEVGRAGLMKNLVKALMRPSAGAGGMTTALWGAGGFGKTTMARLLVHRNEVKEQFPHGVLWVTVGEDAAGPELAEKVTNVVCQLRGERPALTDPLGAGAELGRALGDRRVLLVVDDVWSAAQVEPFLIGNAVVHNPRTRDPAPLH
jgi:hypothetical protein